MLQTAFSLIVTVGRDQLHHPHASGRIEVQILVQSPAPINIWRPCTHYSQKAWNT
jgi:hypothetical protein